MKPKLAHDWLGLPTVYYRESDMVSSTNIWDLINPADIEFDPKGLSSYLRFGYSVFGSTPLRGIRFCQANEKIEETSDGRRCLVRDPDPTEAFIGKIGAPSRAVDMVRAKVNNWEAEIEGPIILPLSGGYDSRFLLSFIKSPSRLRTFTYGLSDLQEQSFEVRYASELAARVGAPWRQITLGRYNYLLDDWVTLQGPSTHAHGMYQMEFYRQVRLLTGTGRPLLSGLIGDAWAKINIPSINSPLETLNLAYNHGLCADPNMLTTPPSWELESIFLEEKAIWLKEPSARVIESMRLKLILLSYLLRVPEHYGFVPFAPFLDIDIAMEMLTIPDDQRKERQWQQDYFRQNNLMIEDCPPISDTQNTLNAQSCRISPPPPLDEHLLSSLFRRDYVRWINSGVASYANWRRFTFLSRWMPVYGSTRIQRILGITDDRLKAYCAYLTLYPLNVLLQARELARINSR
jgi:hypothetical protein